MRARYKNEPQRRQDLLEETESIVGKVAPYPAREEIEARAAATNDPGFSMPSGRPDYDPGFSMPSGPDLDPGFSMTPTPRDIVKERLLSSPAPLPPRPPGGTASAERAVAETKADPEVQRILEQRRMKGLISGIGRAGETIIAGIAGNRPDYTSFDAQDRSAESDAGILLDERKRRLASELKATNPVKARLTSPEALEKMAMERARRDPNSDESRQARDAIRILAPPGFVEQHGKLLEGMSAERIERVIVPGLTAQKRQAFEEAKEGRRRAEAADRANAKATDKANAASAKTQAARDGARVGDWELAPDAPPPRGEDRSKFIAKVATGDLLTRELGALQKDFETLATNPSERLVSEARSRIEAKQALIAPQINVLLGQGAMANEEYARMKMAVGDVASRDFWADLIRNGLSNPTEASKFIAARLNATRDFFNNAVESNARALNYQRRSGSAPSGKVLMRSPEDGRLYEVDESERAEAEANGWKRAR